MCLCVIQAFCFGQLRSSVWSAEHYQQTAQEREDTIFSQPGHNTAASVSRPRWRFSSEYQSHWLMCLLLGGVLSDQCIHCFACFPTETHRAACPSVQSWDRTRLPADQAWSRGGGAGETAEYRGSAHRPGGGTGQLVIVWSGFIPCMLAATVNWCLLCKWCLFEQEVMTYQYKAKRELKATERL